MMTDWQVPEVGNTCRRAAGPGSRRSVQIEWISAGTALLGFPALLSVPHLLSREIMMNRRHYQKQKKQYSRGKRIFCNFTRTTVISKNFGILAIPLLTRGKQRQELFWTIYFVPWLVRSRTWQYTAHQNMKELNLCTNTWQNLHVKNDTKI